MLAECGGYMYLCRQVTSFEGRDYRMAGLIPEVCRMEKRLQTVGYVEATALADNVLCKAGESLRGHEFHFSSEAAPPEAAPFTFVRLRNQARYAAGQQWKNVLGSYLHLHFAGCPSAAQSFVARCADWRQGGSLWEK